MIEWVSKRWWTPGSQTTRVLWRWWCCHCSWSPRCWSCFPASWPSPPVWAIGEVAIGWSISVCSGLMWCSTECGQGKMRDVQISSSQRWCLVDISLQSTSFWGLYFMPVFLTRRYTIFCPVAISALKMSLPKADFWSFQHSSTNETAVAADTQAALKSQLVARYATTTLLAILVFLLPMLFLGFQSKIESQLGHQRGLSQRWLIDALDRWGLPWRVASNSSESSAHDRVVQCQDWSCSWRVMAKIQYIWKKSWPWSRSFDQTLTWNL